MSLFVWLETTQKNVTSHFHTMFGSRDTNFRPFLAKIGICGSKFQPNINPMIVGCVQHYSTHFIKILEKSLEPISHNVQKTAKKGQKMPQIGPKMTILAYLLLFKFLVHFSPKIQHFFNLF